MKPRKKFTAYPPVTMNKLPKNRSITKSMVLTRTLIDAWQAPGFQRPITDNAKLERYAMSLLKSPVIASVIHLGRWEGNLYTIDGRHRLEGFRRSGLAQVRADVNIKDYASGEDGMREMAYDYVILSATIAKQRPDDGLRALEKTNGYLKSIRMDCPFVGYDQIRRNASSPLLSMAVALSAWHGSANEVPRTPKAGAIENATCLTLVDCTHLTQFLKLAYTAWGNEFNNRRLWSTLNITLCMWVYRRMVMFNANSLARATKLTPEQFLLGLRGLAGSANYVEWLTNRSLHERERSPAYGRLRAVFVGVLNEALQRRTLMPSPSWYSGRGNA
jgi:hypothetical protein